jgi:hypothetical protein
MLANFGIGTLASIECPRDSERSDASLAPNAAVTGESGRRAYLKFPQKRWMRAQASSSAVVAVA